MEKSDIDLLVCENQIEFDYSLLESKYIEEEASMVLPEGFVTAKNHDWIDSEVLFVLVKAESNNLGATAYNLDLCGKAMMDWVLIAGNGCEQKIIADPKENVFHAVKQIETEKQYIAVFYSDTPLMEKATFYKVMDYFAKNNMNALALPRGYVFKTEFVRSSENFVSGKITPFDEKSFLRVDSAEVLSSVSKYLFDKIRNFHLRNGVIMYGGSTIFIDADVEIEAGAIIYPNNILRGQTYVGKNVILEANNIISDSIISDDAFIVSSFIDKSKVEKGKAVVFEKLINSAN